MPHRDVPGLPNPRALTTSDAASDNLHPAGTTPAPNESSHPATSATGGDLELPAGTVTGVGSLPHTDAGAAVERIATFAPQLPFWPQLPKRAASEGMIEQAIGPFEQLLRPRCGTHGYTVRPGYMGEMLSRLSESPAGLEPGSAAGFFAFEQAMHRRRLPDALALKGQLIGPTTLALNLFRGDGPGRAFADHPLLRSRLAEYLARAAAWQVERLAAFGLPVMISVDEPALGFTRFDVSDDFERVTVDALAIVLDAIRQAGGHAAVHCCASIDHRFLGALRPDLWSFDCHQGVGPLSTMRPARDYAESEGRLAFGIVPTVDQPGSLCEKELFLRWLNTAMMLGDPQQIAGKSLVTATCGLGLLSPRAAEASFDRCRAVGALIHEAASCQLDT